MPWVLLPRRDVGRFFRLALAALTIKALNEFLHDVGPRAALRFSSDLVKKHLKFELFLNRTGQILFEPYRSKKELLEVQKRLMFFFDFYRGRTFLERKQVTFDCGFLVSRELTAFVPDITQNKAACGAKKTDKAGVYVMPESIIRNSKWP